MQAVKSRYNALNTKHKEALKEAVEEERKLTEIIRKAVELERLVVERTSELNEVEDELDEAESRLQGYTEKLADAEKATEESRQARKQLENRGTTDSNRVAQLERVLEDLRTQNAEIVDDFKAVKVRLQESEETLDIEEERVESADARVKELEFEVTQVGNSLRSMEIWEQQGTVRVTSGDSKMTQVEARYKAKNEEATSLEFTAGELEKLSDTKDDELNEARTTHEKVKEEFDALVSELHEI